MATCTTRKKKGGERKEGERREGRRDKILQRSTIAPMLFGPKEGRKKKERRRKRPRHARPLLRRRVLLAASHCGEERKKGFFLGFFRGLIMWGFFLMVFLYCFAYRKKKGRGVVALLDSSARLRERGKEKKEEAASAIIPSKRERASVLVPYQEGGKGGGGRHDSIPTPPRGTASFSVRMSRST